MKSPIKSRLQLAWDSMTDDQRREMATFDQSVRRSDARYRRLVCASTGDGSEGVCWQPGDDGRVLPARKKCVSGGEDGEH